MAGAFDFAVELPERRASSLGRRRRPRATLVMSEGGDEDRRELPVAVARRLKGVADEHPERLGSAEDVLACVERLELACAHERMEGLVDRRDYARAELEARLRDDGYPPRVVDVVVGRAAAAGVVDDRRFAASFVSAKVAAGWGMARIARELGRRGIDAEALPGWPYDFLDPDDEYGRAVALAGRRRLTGRDDVARLARFLASRGFSGDVCFRAAREVVSRAQGESSGL